MLFVRMLKVTDAYKIVRITKVENFDDLKFTCTLKMVTKSGHLFKKTVRLKYFFGQILCTRQNLALIIVALHYSL